MSLNLNMLIDKLKTIIKKYGLIVRGDKILIGVSGGPDSLTLLYLLKSLSKELNLKLHIAHLDHQLRKESSKDKEFVEKLSAKLKIPFTSAKANINKPGSVEENARNARLEFLFTTAQKIKADKIALGHNLDDQAETILMRLIRGSGLYGLSAILPKRKIKGHTIIRPLLGIKRSEIESFLKKKKVTPRIDRTNLEDVYLRNRIRHKLLPLLEKSYNKNIKEVLSNTSEGIADDYDFLNNKAGQLIKNGANRIELNKLTRLHPAMRRLVLRLMVNHLKGDMRRITFKHVREIEDLIFDRPTNSIVDLPKGISVSKNKKYLCFYRRRN